MFNFLIGNPKFISDIDPTYKCKLCNNVMIDASYLRCGCQFCYKCIRDYLQDNNNESTCPTCDLDCRNETQLEIIQRNEEINVKIKKLLVKCSNKFCDFQDQLEKIVLHSETCDQDGIKCPLDRYGCESEGFSKNSLSDHMRENQEKHLNILVNLNKELQSRLNLMKVEKVHLSKENRELKDELHEFVMKDEELKQEMIEIFDEVKNQNEEMKTRLDNLENENKKMGEEMLNLTPCALIVDGIQEKKECDNVFWSPAMYTNPIGYKIQIGVRFFISGYFGFFCRILKSKNDDKLIWPCKKIIQIKIKSHKTQNIFLKLNIRFDESCGCRPTKDENPTQSYYRSYNYSGFIWNDQIHLFCKVINKSEPN